MEEKLLMLLLGELDTVHRSDIVTTQLGKYVVIPELARLSMGGSLCSIIILLKIVCHSITRVLFNLASYNHLTAPPSSSLLRLP
jgi:hypothetical protein